ncbi:uncharacterized protein LOC127718186 [Mytilus californianus]|uniref:uncharacterized protein LOC127718186 n=1 Tax=Mytilus californianus TaxID=6549 RepID=UPI00224622A9|nr:uncharacterized protein LOC127718186 [Mytilus californianus]
MNTMMPNAFVQGICLLIFWSAVKGVEFYNFFITDIECIDGNVSVTMICNVNNTRNGIKICRNNQEIAYCTTYYLVSIIACTNTSQQYEITNLTIVNDSMIYRIESAPIDNLIGKWVCQNGGSNDPSWSLSFPNITCPPKNNPAPKCDHDNDMVEKKRVADIFMMLAPLIGCGFLTYKTIPAKHKVIRGLCLLGFSIYFVMYILLIALDMSLGVTIALTVVCCLIGIIFVIFVIRKRK